MPPTEPLQPIAPEPRHKLVVPLLITIILLLVVVVILLAVKKAPQSEPELIPEPVPVAQSNVNPQNAVVVAEWRAMPEAALINIAAQENIGIMPDSGISLSRTLDITGDGLDEAVFVGNGGNNDLSFIMMKVGDQKFVARAKSKDGTIGVIGLLSVGRVKFQESWKLLPEEHGFYTASLTMNDETTGKWECNSDGVSAYQWNSSTGLFEWNAALTAKYTAEVCN